MIQRLTWFLAVPQFPDAEKMRRANWLNRFLWAFTALLLALLPLLPFVPLGRILYNRALVIIATGLLMNLVGLYLVRRGFVRQTGWLVLAASFALNTVAIVNFNGIRSTMVMGYFVIVALDGLFLGRRATAVSLVLSIVTLSAVYYAEQVDWIRPDLSPKADIGDLALLILALSLHAVLLQMLISTIAENTEEVRRTAAALSESNRELQASQASLQKLHAGLEDRVRQRTAELSQANARLQHEIAERQEAEAALARRNRELTLFNQIIAATTSALSVTEVLQATCRELALAFGVPQAAAVLLNRDRTASTVVAEYLSEGRPSALGEKIPIQGNPAMETVLRQKRPLAIADVLNDQRQSTIHGLLQRRGTVSLVIAPLVVRGEVIGTIGLDATESRRFNDEEIALIGSVTAAVSQTLYATQLFEEERQQRALAEALRDTAALLTSTLNLDEVLDRILANVGRVVTHDTSNIMLVEGDEARIVRSRGYIERGLSGYVDRTRFSVSEAPNLHYMRDTFQPIYLPDAHKFEGWIKNSEVTFIRSNLSAPIFIDDELFGFIHLDSTVPRAFTATQMERLQVFANQAAVAIQNARLHAQAERHASELEQKVAARTAELQTANAHLQELALVKDAFVSNVSHELRTPIASLKLRQDLIERNPDGIDRHMAVMRRETERLNRIIEDLLRLSRLDQGRMKFDPVTADLNQIVMQYVNDRRLLAKRRGQTIILEGEPDLPPVEADVGLLGQVLGILLTNALAYTSPMTVITVTTQAYSWQGEQWVGFSVHDTGPGILLEEQPRLFERFFRGAVGRQSGAPGTGLGLAIACQIVSQHNGRLELFSTGIPGEGAVFTVWLPGVPITEIP